MTLAGPEVPESGPRKTPGSWALNGVTQHLSPEAWHSSLLIPLFSHRTLESHASSGPLACSGQARQELLRIPQRPLRIDGQVSRKNS